MLKPDYQEEQEDEELESYVGPLHTLSDAFTMITEEESPWIALGFFMHDFFGQHRQNREALLRDPLLLHGPVPLDLWKWAVFCAASAVHLSGKYHLPCPEWALDPLYCLQDPWYQGLGSLERLRNEAPQAYRERNIFCPARIWANKYEVEDLAERRVNYLSTYNALPQQNTESA